jgi:hypothetical protein
MPYFITDEHPDCESWAVVKENGELLGCHSGEVSAIDQMVAVSLAEDVMPGGTYKGDTFLPFDPTRGVAKVMSCRKRNGSEDENSDSKLITTFLYEGCR